VPSAFAHALVGASLSSILPRQQRAAWVVALLAFAAAAPDLDVIAFRLGIPYEHPLGHRGLTHSLFFAAAVALLSLPVWRHAFDRNAGTAAVLTFLAVASHGVLDVFTDGGLGIGLFIPLDNGRYFSPWRPILTSPISVSGFFSTQGLAILFNEAFWVGFPTFLFLVLVLVIRRSSKSPRDST
jgi:inner membrane protein